MSAVAILCACTTGAPPAGPLCADGIHADETELVHYPGVLTTSRVGGTVTPSAGGGWLTENRPSLEIWPHHDTTARRSYAVGLDGRLEAFDLPPGDYCFRASASGFSGVIGLLRIVKSAKEQPLELLLPLAF